MISEKEAHNGINLGFHVLILFIFLTIFFFTYITKREKKLITKEIDAAIESNVPEILDGINKLPKEKDYVVNWYGIKSFAENLDKKYDNKPDKKIESHDKHLLYLAIIICCVLLILIVGGMIYFKYHRKYDLGLKTILFENFIIAICVGMIELIFFFKVASKYSPIMKSDMVNQINKKNGI